MKQRILTALTLDELNSLINQAINEVSAKNIFLIGGITFDGTNYSQNLVYIFE